MDIMSPALRSLRMARIKGRDTKPELMVRRYLHSHGLRFRLHDRKLEGSPDLVFRSRKTVVFVHGCFWHGHEGCSSFRLPGSRTEFWAAKISGNRDRDSRAMAALAASGWRVAIVWTCALRGKAASDSLAALEGFIRSDVATCEIRASALPSVDVAPSRVAKPFD